MAGGLQAVTVADPQNMAEQLRAAGAVKPPDPEAMGKIRFIVRSAHKWGGDGRKPKFRKIRRVLLSKHPEVIAKAFGGDPNKAAGWIKANWYRMRGLPVPGTRGKKVTAMEEEAFVRVLSSEEEGAIVEMGVSDVLTLASPKSEKDDDGYIVKTLLRTGEWKYWPNGLKKDLKIDKKFLEEVVEAFDAGVVPHVTIPFNSHDDGDMTKNVGFVREVWIERSRRDKSRWLLKGKLEFTEPDVKAKVERGTYPDVSVFVDLRGTRDPETEKVWPKVMKHATITHRPFVSQMNDKKLAAISGGNDSGLGTWELDIDNEVEADLAAMFGNFAGASGEVAYDETEDWDTIRQRVGDVIRSPEYRKFPDGDSIPPESYVFLWKMNSEKALVRVSAPYGSSEEPRFFVAGWEMSDGKATVDPPDEWLEVHNRWIEAIAVNASDWHEFTDERATNGGGDTPMATQSGAPAEGETPGTITMTKEEFDRRLAAIDQDRQKELDELKATIAASKERDERTRRELHEARVERMVAKWESDKIPPAVIVEAKAAISGVESDAEKVLTMSVVEKSDDGEKTTDVDLTLMQVVDRIVSSMPSAQDGGGSVKPKIAETNVTGTTTKLTAIAGGDEKDAESTALELEQDLGIASTTTA
jgi:hypothetical protein